jgi:hypothetical protein
MFGETTVKNGSKLAASLFYREKRIAAIHEKQKRLKGFVEADGLCNGVMK